MDDGKRSIWGLHGHGLPCQGIVCIPVDGLDPARLAIAWRRDDRRPAIRDFISACRDVATEAGGWA